MIKLKNDRFSILITADMRRRASARSKEGGVSLGEWIRRAMEASLAAAEHPNLCDCPECVSEAEWAQ